MEKNISLQMATYFISRRKSLHRKFNTKTEMWCEIEGLHLNILILDLRYFRSLLAVCFHESIYSSYLFRYPHLVFYKFQPKNSYSLSCDRHKTGLILRISFILWTHTGRGRASWRAPCSIVTQWERQHRTMAGTQ